MLQRWTTDNFDNLGWHDCHIHGFRLAEAHADRGTAELEFDIDYILEWLRQDDARFRFRLAPATLTFHDVYALRVTLDYASPGAGMTPFAIDEIEREPVTHHPGDTRFRWRLPINWPAGEITFESTGFTQILRGEPIEHDAQSLPADRRGG